MDCGIYKITDVATGDYYIGSSKEIKVRRTQHYSDLRCGRHANSHLQSIHNKGRELKFELIIATRPNDRIMYEQRCLDLLEPVLNKALDAVAPMEGKTHSEEYCELQRQRALSPDSPLKSPEAVANRSGDNHYMRRPDYDKSKHPSKNPEAVAKRTAKVSGDNHYTKKPNYNPENHPMKSPEARAKKSESMTGEKHPRSKLTLGQAIEIIISDKSCEDLINEYGIKATQVSRIKTRKSWQSAYKIINEIHGSNEEFSVISERYKIDLGIILKIKGGPIFSTEVIFGNASGAKNGNSKTSEEQAQSVLDFVGTHSEAARKYGVSKKTAIDIRNRKTWKHLVKNAKE